MKLREVPRAFIITPHEAFLGGAVGGCLEQKAKMKPGFLLFLKSKHKRLPAYLP